ncbi:uncharacterized protein LOC144145101 [Haemaphysalis longicornis]
MCVRSVREGNGLATLVYTFENNGSLAYTESQKSEFTDVPDVVDITYERDNISTTFRSTVPYGDYEACFVGKIDSCGMIECHLLVFINATSCQATKCMQGLTQACPGPVYDTWNEELCK